MVTPLVGKVVSCSGLKHAGAATSATGRMCHLSICAGKEVGAVGDASSHVSNRFGDESKEEDTNEAPCLPSSLSGTSSAETTPLVTDVAGADDDLDAHGRSFVVVDVVVVRAAPSVEQVADRKSVV